MSSQLLIAIGCVGLVVLLWFRPRVGLSVVGVLLVFAALPVIGIWAYNASLDVDKGEWVEQNRAFLDTVPIYPGAQLEREFHVGRRHPHGLDWHGFLPDENREDPPHGPYQQWITYRVYRLPSSARPDAVRAFYRVKLSRGFWYGDTQSFYCAGSFRRAFLPRIERGAPFTVDACKTGTLTIAGSYKYPGDDK